MSIDACIATVENSRAHFLITGKAGTGKSTLIRRLMSTTEKQAVVLAPTGRAAINVQGQTIHSFFRFSPGVTVHSIKRNATRERAPELIRHLETIIIDEVSMVRADLLDCVDTYLRIHRGKPRVAFGGVQMVLVGDLYQLPPVVTAREANVFRKRYKTEYFFSSRAFREIERDRTLERITLDEVVRQSDARFVSLLDRIREARVTAEDLAVLNSRVVDEKDIPAGTVYLTARRSQADRINALRLDELPGKLYEFPARVTGAVDPRHYPTDERLFLKRGAQVMIIVNDRSKSWVNGTTATVERIRPSHLVLRLADGRREEVLPYTWDIYQYYYDRARRRISSRVIGSFTQYPIRLAWAVTIHKSQGMTLSRAAIDLGAGAFAPGQVYVALSRCTALDGIYLTTPIRESDILVDWRIDEFDTGSYGVDGEACETEPKLPVGEVETRIRKAIQSGLCLKIVYAGRRRGQTERLIMPLELMEMDTAPALRAYCFLRNAERSFRLDRIVDVQLAPCGESR